MRSVWLAGIAAAAALHAGDAIADDVVEVDLVLCATLSRDSEHSERLILMGSLARAEAAWIVRDPRVQAATEGVVWCREMSARDIVPETCRTGGPPITAGDIEFAAAETLIGEKARSARFRGRETARVAFTDEFHSNEPDASCAQGARFEVIESVGYFSPNLTALAPSREYLLVVTPDDEGRVVLLAFALTDQPEQTKRTLRKLARRQAKSQ